jgi:hypothetical protein
MDYNPVPEKQGGVFTKAGVNATITATCKVITRKPHIVK